MRLGEDHSEWVEDATIVELMFSSGGQVMSESNNWNKIGNDWERLRKKATQQNENEAGTPIPTLRMS